MDANQAINLSNIKTAGGRPEGVGDPEKNDSLIKDFRYGYIGKPSAPQAPLLPLMAPAYRRSRFLCIHNGARLS